MWSILYCVRNDPERLRASQRRRGLDETVVDEAVRLDREWRELKARVDRLRHELNRISSAIPKLGDDEKKKAVEEARRLSALVAEEEARLRRLEEERERVLLSIPNILHESVPEGRDESDNVPVRYWGRPRVWRGHLERFLEETKGFEVEYEVIDYMPVGHADAVEAMGWADVRRAAKVAGARFYYLYEDLVWLDFALMLYALDFLSRRGFRLVEPPFMMRRAALEGVISFDDFRDMIYKVEGEDLSLIGTAEHPLAALHMDEVIPRDELPLLYAGVSPCFRKEAGAHGKDTKGIFRTHQFNKVEQFVFCKPEESWVEHERLLENAESIIQKLGLPYRITNVCTGDIGTVAAKKYDIEVWMPAQKQYREVISCSNCTDYQARRLNIKYREMEGRPPKGFVHTLNSTAIATGRIIVAILENFQERNGSVRIPEALQSYMRGVTRISKD